MKLVLCPLTIEFDALKSVLSPTWESRDADGIKVWIAKDFALAIGGHGKVQFALTAQHLARELKPSLLICAGACGALVQGPALRDIIAAESTVEHDYNLKFVKRPLPTYDGDAESLKKLRALGLSKIHFGIVASGDEDIIDAVRSQELQKSTGAIAVAWEGAGGARAAAFCGIPFLELRTVTDSANQHAPADFKENVSQGMKNIAEVLRLTSGV